MDLELLEDPDARYPTTAIQELWRRSVNAVGDDNFGVDVGMQWSPTTFHALGFAWLASSSMKDGLTRLVRYSSMVNDCLRTSFGTYQGGYVIKLSLMGGEAKPHYASTDASIAALIKMIRLLVSETYSPESIRIHDTPSPSRLALESYARCAIEYSYSSSMPVDTCCDVEMIVDANTVERKLPYGNPSLVEINEALVLKYLQALNLGTLVEQVSNQIVRCLPEGSFSERDIAKQLNMSERTLQRKLLESGTSYSVLLNDLRKELSVKYLANLKFAIGEIGYLLGFSEQANFSRAFKRWYQQSPTDYRQKIAGLAKA